MAQMKRNLIVLFLFTLATTYYYLLSAKQWTWVFVSGDSGDWLATANWWMVPQPYGSPLYILLTRLFGLLPGSQPYNLTILLSVIPSAITVAVVYLTVLHLTNKRLIAVTSALVLMGSTVFLTQSTVLEEYALATMFIAAAYLAHIREKHSWAAVAIGLGISVHAFVLGLGIFWLIAEAVYWKKWLRPLGITACIVAVFYSFILVLMAADTPRLLAGSLSFYSLKQYLTLVGGSVVGQISVFEFPNRVWEVAQVLLASFGLALVPAIYATRLSIPRFRLVLLGSVLFVLWYYLTCLDYTAWTFLTFASPAFAILTGIGLRSLPPIHLKVVLVSALGLVLLNGVYMNADILTQERPLAQQYYKELKALPKGAIVSAPAGNYSLGLFYVVSIGTDLVPLIHPYLDDWKFEDYRLWLNKQYDMNIPTETSTVEVIRASLKEGRRVYFAYSDDRYNDLRGQLVLKGSGHVKEVMSVED